MRMTITSSLLAVLSLLTSADISQARGFRGRCCSSCMSYCYPMATLHGCGMGPVIYDGMVILPPPNNLQGYGGYGDGSGGSNPASETSALRAQVQELTQAINDLTRQLQQQKTPAPKQP